MGKHLKILIKKMCKEVGADFDKINFKRLNWFTDYEWTVEQERAFKKVIVEYMENEEARKELMVFPHKKYLESFSDQFVLAYGWKYMKQTFKQFLKENWDEMVEIAENSTGESYSGREPLLSKDEIIEIAKEEWKKL